MHNLHNQFTQSEFELTPEYVNEYDQEYGYANEFEAEITSQEGTFGEASQMELASELLSISNEFELDQFLGSLFKKAKGLIKSGTGRALGGLLKSVAKKALPIAGGAIGTALLPGVGTAVGGALGNAATNLFELEMEGLSQEDREFEMARAFIRLAGNAIKHAASMPQNESDQEIARKALAKSAKRYAPGLLRRRGRSGIYSGRGFGELADRISRLEHVIRDLSEQIQARGGSSTDTASSSDQEYYNY
ncbi:hypothetical protein WBG78_04815 [Chryseolinea sp. T2]|uniref:hypothetical protein n=1 Tax=Chryseolinea sp. T2 TaxID=3129255 RepID=UPI003076C270